MIEIKFLGISSAFQGDDTSILVKTNINILLDCGFSTPKKLKELGHPLDFLDVIYISHAHGDHYFGLAELLYDYWGGDRKKGLTIIAASNCIDKIIKMSELLGEPYKVEGFIKFIEVTEKSEVNIEENVFTFCRTNHIEDNLAIKILHRDKLICYSGDGIPTRNTIDFYKNCDILIHEQTFETQEKYTHSSVKTIDAISNTVDSSKIFIVHSSENIKTNYYKPKSGETIVL